MNTAKELNPTDGLQERIASIDILRGFDMFFIMGSPRIFRALAEITNWAPFIWWNDQMKHCEWNGFTFMDMVFPLFLFIAGVSFPISYRNRKQKQVGSSQSIYIHIAKRVLVLVALGLIYNGIFKAASLADIRYCSVLGRIGISWGLGALIYIHFHKKGRFLWCVGLLMFYWLLFLLFQAPDVVDATRYSLEGNIAGYIDRLLLPGRLSHIGILDAEGLLSTLPSISTALLGMFAGDLLLSNSYVPRKKTLYLLIGGVSCILIAGFWDLLFPINKIIWSSSFTLYAGGFSIVLLGLFYLVFDQLKWCRRISFFFLIIGANSIFIYMIQKIVDFNRVTLFFVEGISLQVSPNWGLLIEGIGRIVILWLLLYYMYKRKIFIKI